MRRSALLLLIASAIPSTVAIAGDQSEAIRKIRLLRGEIRRNDKLPDNPIVSVSFFGSPRFNGKFLHLLKGMDELAYLDLRNTDTTDANLKEIADLENLTVLRLSHVQISDEGLKELRGRQKLHTLDLSGTKITDAGLKELNDLNALKSLDLSETEITGEGLKDLRDLPNLLSLNLENTKVNDRELVNVYDFKQLIRINLRRTKITEAGRKHFSESMPNTRIYDTGPGPAFETLMNR